MISSEPVRAPGVCGFLELRRGELQGYAGEGDVCDSAR